MDDLSAIEIQTIKLGEFLKNVRLASDKSTDECAKAMGITSPEYEAYEQGEKAPSLPEIEALGYYLDIQLGYFLERDLIKTESKGNVAFEKIENLLSLRHRIIGIMIQKARIEAKTSLDELARQTEIDQQYLMEYEMGKGAIPLPELEKIALALNISIRNFQDHNGPIGKWAIQKKAVEDFKELPLEMQQFISKPINLPYLELAKRLSEMSVDRLRSVAEGLLEITL